MPITCSRKARSTKDASGRCKSRKKSPSWRKRGLLSSLKFSPKGQAQKPRISSSSYISTGSTGTLARRRIDLSTRLSLSAIRMLSLSSPRFTRSTTRAALSRFYRARSVSILSQRTTMKKTLRTSALLSSPKSLRASKNVQASERVRRLDQRRRKAEAIRPS